MSGLPENCYDALRSSCALQAPQYPYYNTLPTTYYNNYDYMCAPRTSQGFYTDQVDTMANNNWMADIEKRLKFTDNIETIEITSKDLSPASCCSNVDPGSISNSYNTPYYYNYPSCAQVNNFVQDCSSDYVEPEQFYSQPIVDINQGDCSGESDIVVEDSFSDDSRDNINHFMSNCIVCNIPYTPLGNQFYTLTDKMPLTMSSQRPVYLKLIEALGPLKSKEPKHLCNSCLSLLNSIDHLQLKLETAKTELRSKFQKMSCVKQSQSGHKRYKFRRFCGSHRFNCKFCKKMLTPEVLFKRHLIQHKLEKRFLCELCGRRFTSQNGLKLHILNHQPSIRAFVCRLCEKPFRTKSNLKEHYSYCSDNYPYECCDKKFATASKYKQHRKLKHDKKFIAICSICNVGFVKMSDYKLHKTTHSTEKKFNCAQCGKTYKTASNLNFHTKVHAISLPFTCMTCNKGFMRKDYLEAHINNHKGIKNYICQVCRKRFVSQKGLDAHVKYHDGSVKKRNCNICNKVITTGFDDHLRTHSNLKEFQCDLCVLKFNTKSALSKHKSRKHDSSQ